MELICIVGYFSSPSRHKNVPFSIGGGGRSIQTNECSLLLYLLLILMSYTNWLHKWLMIASKLKSKWGINATDCGEDGAEWTNS